MNERERAELEMYRRMYAAQTAPEPIQPLADSPFGPPAAQDALDIEEQMAFWPEDLDYDPKYKIAERHRQVYSSWPKQGSS